MLWLVICYRSTNTQVYLGRYQQQYHSFSKAPTIGASLKSRGICHGKPNTILAFRTRTIEFVAPFFGEIAIGGLS